MKKQITIFLIIATLLISLFTMTGCSNKNENQNDKNEIKETNNVANKIADTVKNDPFNAVNVINNSKSVVAKTLVLTQTISADSTSDDKSYNNLTELVKVKNTAGRRMAYSVVGNQDPTKEPTEIDADSSQQVTIMPPYGQKYIYYVLGIGIAIILIAGIIVARKITKKE